MECRPFRFKQRRTSVTGKVPDLNGLYDGELYINTTDGNVFFKNTTCTCAASLVSDITPNGLNKLKFSGAATGDFAVWDGTKFVPKGTGNFITAEQTGVFATSFNSGAFVSTGQTGSFITSGQTGNFITSSQTGTFVVAANTGNFVLTSQTGNFITSGQTGLFASSGYFSYNNYGSSNQIKIGSVNNTIASTSSNITILGGDFNSSQGTANHGTIVGGGSNTLASTSCYAVILGGISNVISASQANNLIIGGSSNNIVAGSTCNIILNGHNNTIYGCFNSVLLGRYATYDSYTCCSTVIGGCCVKHCFWANKNTTINSNSVLLCTDATGITILGVDYFTGTSSCSNTVYGCNFCAYKGKYYGDASALTGIATGSFITTGQTGAFGGTTINTGCFLAINSSYSIERSPSVGNDITGRFNVALLNVYSVVSGDCSFVVNTFNSKVNTGVNRSAIIGGAFNCIDTDVSSSVILGGFAITASSSNTAYSNNFCAYGGKFYGDGSSLTSLATGCFITTGQTGAFGAAGYVQNSQTGQFVSTGQTGNFVSILNTGSFITTGQTGAFGGTSINTGSLVGKNETGNFVTTSQTGNLANSFVNNSQLDTYVSKSTTGQFVSTGQTGNFASLSNNYLKSSLIPEITGDVCIVAGTNNSTVYNLQGYPISFSAAPVNGQTLQFNGTTWVPGDIPAGGNGGGGLTYYFNDITPADLPTGNLPDSFRGPYELGRVSDPNQITITTPTLSDTSYTSVVGFVTDLLDPNVASIPAGLFDFNIWASSNTVAQTILQLKVYKYDGSTSPTLLATSDDVYTYDGEVISQYILSVVLPQTTLSLTDRLFIQILAKAVGNNKTLTLYFGGNTPSHVHTTVPSVGGSGLIKVINGVMQSRATGLVDADVSQYAEIAGSKIQNGYFALACKTGTFVTSGQTGNFVTSGTTGNFLTNDQTGYFTGIFLGSGTKILNSSESEVTNGMVNSVVLGGNQNCICYSSYDNVILGGAKNFVFYGPCRSTIAGGYCNRIGYEEVGDSAIIGGCYNMLGRVTGVVIIGGCGNSPYQSSIICNSVILGGDHIVANQSNFVYAHNFCSTGGKYYGDGSALTGVSPDTGYLATIFVATGQTGSFVGTDQTGNFVTTDQTGSFGGGGGSIDTSNLVCKTGGYSIFLSSGDQVQFTRTCNSIVLGPKHLIIDGKDSTIIGGICNQIQQSTGSAHLGGTNSTIYGSNYSALIGGQNNTIQNVSFLATINGGYDNIINCWSPGSAILGGEVNKICCYSVTSSIINGSHNEILCYAQRSVILGGRNNQINCANNSVIVGGCYNSLCCLAENSVILGGHNITASQSNTVYACCFSGAFVGDGSQLTNLPAGDTSSFVTTGQTGNFATIDQIGGSLKFIDDTNGSAYHECCYISRTTTYQNSGYINLCLPTENPSEWDAYFLRVGANGPYSAYYSICLIGSSSMAFNENPNNAAASFKFEGYAEHVHPCYSYGSIGNIVKTTLHKNCNCLDACIEYATNGYILIKATSSGYARDVKWFAKIQMMEMCTDYYWPPSG